MNYFQILFEVITLEVSLIVCMEFLNLSFYFQCKHTIFDHVKLNYSQLPYVFIKVLEKWDSKEKIT